MNLYRPIGLKELDLILQSEGQNFPKRLPNQPIFYPVQNTQYAAQIAERWNTSDPVSGFAGYVTQFEIDDQYISAYEVHQVGGTIHQEYWIPAEELDRFNQHITAPIRIIDAFYGPEYQGNIPAKTNLKNKAWTDQFTCLKALREYNGMDFVCELTVHWMIVNQNYILWQKTAANILNMTETEKINLLSDIHTVLKRNDKWLIAARKGEE